MRRTEILIIKYRRVTVIESSETVRNEVVEAEGVAVETQFSTESRHSPKLFAPLEKKRTWLAALVSKLFGSGPTHNYTTTNSSGAESIHQNKCSKGNSHEQSQT